MSISIGTVIACLNYTSHFQPQKGCCMGPGFSDNTFHQLAFSSNGAGALEWYQAAFAPQYSIFQLLEMAEKISAGADGLTALPCANTYPNREGFKGAKQHHTDGHYIRAILESTTETLKELVTSLCGNELPKRIVATGGGSKSDLWLQIKADMLGTEFVQTDCHEPACRGAAMIAANAINWFSASLSPPPWISINRIYRPSNNE